MKAIILVGGQGTRLRPLTLKQPKPLLPILNKPFLWYQLDMLAKAHVKEVVLAVGADAHLWSRQAQSFKPRQCQLIFSTENKPMGTGGAIRQAFEKIKKKMSSSHEPLIVMNGDVFLNLDAQRFVSSHRRHKADVSVAMTRVPDVSRFGLIHTHANGRIKKFSEKPKKGGPGRINAGAYVLNAGVIRQFPHKPHSIERDMFPLLLKEKKSLFGYLVKGYWNDIGTPKTYLQAHFDLLRLNNRWTQKKLFRKKTLLVGRQSKIAKNVTLKGSVCIGNKVQLESGALLEDSVVLDGCRIESGVRIHKSIIGHGCRIEKESIINEGTVLGEKSTLSPFSKV